MDPTNMLVSLTPMLTTFSYMMQEPNPNIWKIIPYLLPFIIPFLAYFPSWKGWRKNCMKCRRGLSSDTLEYTARLQLRFWRDEPDSVVRCFSILLWELNRLNKLVNCKHLIEELTSSRDYYEYNSDDEDSAENISVPIFVDDAENMFWNKDQPNIKYIMWVERNTDREGNQRSDVILKIVFDASEFGSNNVVKHIEYIRKEARRIKQEQKRKQLILVNTAKSDRSEKSGPKFTIYEFHTTSSFANFYSEEADIVCRDLKQFMEDKELYVRTGRPWTYTVLNEGPPGVGKTKLVKAIAEKTGYTLIVLNLVHIKNIDELYDAFHNSVLAGERVPHDKRLYYIPEVDTQMFEILKSRKEKEKEKQKEKQKEKETIHLEDVEKVEKGEFGPLVDKQTNKLTLGEILNALDGIPERHGHILIMDTNHLSDLDPAFIRPGRVDRILHWKPMSSNSIRKYLANYFQTTIPEIEFYENKYTAAEFQSIVYRCETLEKVIEMCGVPCSVPKRFRKR